MADKNIIGNNEWTFDKIEKMWKVIDRIAKEKYGLDYNEPRFEVVTYEQMIDISCSHGMPDMYSHWSFGKHFVKMQNDYHRGMSGLAYEIVINTNPAVAYLMENNTMTMQALVMAHASVGHASFFKNNYLFKTHTNANWVLGYMKYANEFIQECEQKYGLKPVEHLLDACHALQFYGIDYNFRQLESSKHREERYKAREKKRTEAHYDSLNEMWDPVQKLKRRRRILKVKDRKQELNILKYIEKNSPTLKVWQRKMINIVRTLSQYFYPQMLTKVMNEGWASFWHYTLMYDLYEEGHIDEGHMLEFLHSHTAVVTQPSLYSPGYSGINPYALGFNMFKDIRRICEDPTEEDKEHFPDIAGSDWVETLKYIAENYNDSSFIRQFLSPKVIRDMKLIRINDSYRKDYYGIEDIHNEDGYESIAYALSKQCDFRTKLPLITITPLDLTKSRMLKMCHFEDENGDLDGESFDKMMSYIYSLWRNDIKFYIYPCESLLEEGESNKPSVTVYPERRGK